MYGFGGEGILFISERILGLLVGRCQPKVPFCKVPLGFLLKLLLFSFYMGNLFKKQIFKVTELPTLFFVC